MKSNKEDILLLDKYIFGQLDNVQIKEVEQRLTTDIDFLSDYEYLKKVASDARLVSLQEAMTTIKNVEKNLETKSKIKQGLVNIRLKYLLIAVVILSLVFVGIKYVKNEKSKYPEQYADIFENRFEKEMILHVTYRSPSQNDQFTRQQKQAYDLYALKEFKTAIPMLQNLWESERDTLALYYWGISELGVGQVIKSREILSDSALIKYNTSFIHKSKTK